MEKNKIGHISTDYKPIFGGAETYLANLFKVLEAAGYDQRVYQRDMGVKAEELVLIPRLPKWLRVRNRGSELWAFNLFLLSKLKQIKKEDLLIVHYPFQFLPVFWHKRVLVLSHGVEWMQPPGSLNHKLKKKIAQMAFKKAQYIVANDSNFFREMGINLRPQEGMFEEIEKNKWFLPNCVDVNHFAPNKGLEQLKRLNPILVPRNISFGRGIHLAVRAFADFCKKFPETNLVVTGDIVDNDYFAAVLKLIKELSLSGKVFFLGGIPWQKMPEVYASARLTIIPTIFSEGTSLSALESMACGVATVSTNVGGLPDLPTVLSDTSSTHLFELMVTTYERQQAIGEQQRREVLKTYNLERWSQTWEKIVVKALGA